MRGAGSVQLVRVRPAKSDCLGSRLTPVVSCPTLGKHSKTQSLGFLMCMVELVILLCMVESKHMDTFSIQSAFNECYLQVALYIYKYSCYFLFLHQKCGFC